MEPRRLGKSPSKEQFTCCNQKLAKSSPASTKYKKNNRRKRPLTSKAWLRTTNGKATTLQPFEVDNNIAQRLVTEAT
ncbi:unnamed protein product [Prunus armeniaca]|uniref:Uncharacterized protein n=1 Tax=Prunus armeniaca TaxID=36596 RepID=A0A6J5UQ88_PRUAR|nr:unnamed protein product [Prunus armeniaca]